uniref:SUMO-activating enzyme subunit 1 n=1 Tax=Anopheles atroparvus TaxID=41427 RepID=A0AAG5CTY8_ANOAO
MVESNGVQLTEQEAELYDRQIRLWGLDSQKRIRAARVLIAGLNGLGAEIAKNVILAGVKSVTLLDDRKVTEEDFCSQFLAPQSAVGNNRAEASLTRAQNLNPMVELKADTDTLASKPDEFFKDFDVVCLIGAPTAQYLRVDNACREANVKFFASDVWGMFGTVFVDLQEHEFVEDVYQHKVISKATKTEKEKTEYVCTPTKRQFKYPSYQALVDFDFRAPANARSLKRNSLALPMMRVLQKFRDEEQRDPAYGKREEDYKKLLELRDAEAPGMIPDSSFGQVFAQIAPVTAIVGGAVGHEIIKAVSKKETPHKNLVLFDPEQCTATIVEVGCEK